MDHDGNIISLNSSNISDLTDQEVKRILEQSAILRIREGLFYHHHTYSYMMSQTSRRSDLIVVLDSLNQFRHMTLVHLSIWMSGISFIFFVLRGFRLCSGKVIKPFIRNYERQRRFITNAGCELKTPCYHFS